MDTVLNPHIIPYYACSAWTAIITITLLIKKPQYKLYLPNLGILLWFIGIIGYSLSPSETQSIFWSKIVYGGIIVVCPTLYHFIIDYLKLLRHKFYYYSLTINYFIAAVFILLNFFTPHLTSLQTTKWFTYTKAESLHPFFMIWFTYLALQILSVLFKSLLKTNSQ